MQRVTITVEDEFLTELDAVIEKRGYQNRSEAIRDLVRAGIHETADEGRDGDCVAALVYVYDHGTRELSKRLANIFHDHHDLSLAATHIHLDHDSCMEVAFLRGAGSEVRHLADHVISERGVRHGRLVKIPAEMKSETHSHGDHKHRHLHVHVRRAG